MDKQRQARDFGEMVGKSALSSRLMVAGLGQVDVAQIRPKG
jgi:hypothetical protein